MGWDEQESVMEEKLLEDSDEDNLAGPRSSSSPSSSKVDWHRSPYFSVGC